MHRRLYPLWSAPALAFALLSAAAAEPPAEKEPKRVLKRLDRDSETLKKIREKGAPVEPGRRKRVGTVGGLEGPEDRRIRERANAAKRAQEIFGGKPVSSAYLNESTRHARRVAEIERIRDVANSKGDIATANRARTLLSRELARHDQWVDRYQEHATTQLDEEKAEAP